MSLGKLSYDPEGFWAIEPVAHVAIRLKRVFAQIRPSQHGQLVVTATKEVARDLEWFLKRYPLEISRHDLQFLKSEAEAHRDGETLVEKLLAGIEEPRDFDMELQPRDYQKLAAELFLTRKSLLLADELGLGKTCAAITALTHAETRPALVVTKTNLTRQWQREFMRFAPGISTHIIQSTKPYDVTKGAASALATKFSRDRLPDVLITSYSKLTPWAETLRGVVRTAVFDEVQEFRRGDQANKGQSARHITEACTYKLGLSATPVYNYGGEIYNIFNILEPGALGSVDEFHREHCHGVDGKWKLNDAKAFGEHLRKSGMMLRRSRRDVGQEIPALSRIVHHVDHDARAIDNVRDRLEILANQYLRGCSKEARFTAGGQFDMLLREATGIAKAPHVADFVQLLLEQGERVVLFGFHHAVYQIWAERLHDYKPAFYHGRCTLNEKEEAQRRFMSGETNLLIISVRSGDGLDGLQFGCSTVVIGELDWSPSVIRQCIGRIHRPGQESPVMAYLMLSNGGSDPDMADTLNIKDAQARGILEPDAETAEPFDSSGAQIRKVAERYLNLQRKNYPAESRMVVTSADLAPVQPEETVEEEDRGPVLLGVDISVRGLGLVAAPLDWNGDWSQVASMVIRGDLQGCATDNQRASLATHMAGSVVDFAVENGCTEAWFERILTHNAFQVVTLAGLDMVVRAELLREGVDLNSVDLSSGRKLFLGFNPRSTKKKKVDVKRTYILPAFQDVESPFVEANEHDVRDACIALNFGMKERGGFHYANVLEQRAA